MWQAKSQLCQVKVLLDNTNVFRSYNCHGCACSVCRANNVHAPFLSRRHIFTYVSSGFLLLHLTINVAKIRKYKHSTAQRDVLNFPLLNQSITFEYDFTQNFWTVKSYSSCFSEHNGNIFFLCLLTQLLLPSETLEHNLNNPHFQKQLMF